MKQTNIYKVLALIVMLAMAHGALAQNRRSKEFVGNMQEYEQRYKEFMRQGRYREALPPLDTLINTLDTTMIYQDAEANISQEYLRQGKAFYRYDKACILALTGKKKQALAALEQSVNDGYKDYVNMLNDNDLASLRKDKKFQTLLVVVAGRSSLGVLRKSAPYGKEEGKEPPFSYQSPESKTLRMVREYFNLDSVAGTGDELSKIINLLHFAHDNMEHDGAHRAFVEMDAIDLYNYCKATGRGINCRQLAISLCEMYLAMGMPARYVTCMPADPRDTECHVINSVWSSQLGKWLYIDPTMDAWVMDENGTMLSIAEVRQRLIDGSPLVLCETANWNHEIPQTKEHYLEQYMAKNLYYFDCIKASRFNPESDYRGFDQSAYIKLVPVGFVGGVSISESTTDAELFWAEP